MSRDQLADNEVFERAEIGSGSRTENLALFYQGILTGIVRLQAKRQQLGDTNKFRNRMRTALEDIRRDAGSFGYSAEDIRDAEFATVAFLDEVILTLDDPGRQTWAKQTLGVDLYGEPNAGEIFFEKLESYRSRRDSQQLADLLEVFLLCLLLGFEGRYTGLRGELHGITERLRRRIESIRQGDLRLAPDIPVGPLSEPVAAPVAVPILPHLHAWRWAFLTAIGSAVLVYLGLKLHLVWSVGRLAEAIRS
jgi:type VI secretion system protein ImpK